MRTRRRRARRDQVLNAVPTRTEDRKEDRKEEDRKRARVSKWVGRREGCRRTRVLVHSARCSNTTQAGTAPRVFASSVASAPVWQSGGICVSDEPRLCSDCIPILDSSLRKRLPSRGDNVEHERNASSKKSFRHSLGTSRTCAWTLYVRRDIHAPTIPDILGSRRLDQTSTRSRCTR